ncbi:unnamed protein product [Malus baccata var. baccata]
MTPCPLSPKAPKFVNPSLWSASCSALGSVVAQYPSLPALLPLSFSFTLCFILISPSLPDFRPTSSSLFSTLCFLPFFPSLPLFPPDFPIFPFSSNSTPIIGVLSMSVACLPPFSVHPFGYLALLPGGGIGYAVVVRLFWWKWLLYIFMPRFFGLFAAMGCSL